MSHLALCLLLRVQQLEKGRDHGGLELAAAALDELLAGRRGLQPRAINAVARHRLVGVCHGQDGGLDGDPLAR